MESLFKWRYDTRSKCRKVSSRLSWKFLLFLVIVFDFTCEVAAAEHAVAMEDPVKSLRNVNTGLYGGEQETECSHVRHRNASFQCDFVKEVNDCYYSPGFIQYVYFVYCDLNGYSPWALVLLGILLIYLFVALGVTAEEFFCPCLKTFSKALHMSDSVAGVTLLALGNGAPDIFSVLAAITSGGQDTTPLAFQELFGAGIFVTTVVSGSIQLKSSFKLARRPFIRDLIFYISAVCWTFAVMYRKEIRTAEAVGFIVLYVIYVTLVIAGQALNRTIRNTGTVSDYESTVNSTDEVVVKRTRQQRRAWIEDLHASADFTEFESNERSALVRNIQVQSDQRIGNVTSSDIDEDEKSDESTLERLTGVQVDEWRSKTVFWKFLDIVKIPLEIIMNLTNPIIDIEVKGYKWHKFLIMLQCVISPVACAFITEKAFVPVYGKLVVWNILLILGAVMALIVMITTSRENPPKFCSIFAVAGFIVSVIWIYALAQEIVNLLKTFGVALGISNAVLGLTLLAWGNSIGDFISNMAMASNGAPRMAISACYGGPLLNMVLGVGISCTVSSITHNGDVELIRGHLQYILSASFLGASLLAALTLMPILKFNTSRVFGIFLIVFYFTYLTVSILNEFRFL